MGMRQLSKQRVEEIIKQVKRSDEYAEKGMWEASDGMVVHLHNEGQINFLIERVQELEDVNKRHRETLERVKDSIPLEFNHGSEYEAKKNVIRMMKIHDDVEEALEET